MPPEIGNLRKLRRLNLSENYLEALLIELGLLIDLRILNLYGNRIACLPSQLSSLGKLEKLFLDRNPIAPKQKEAYAKGGIPALIKHLHSNAPALSPPKPRRVLDLVDFANSSVNNRISVLSYNTLNARSANPAWYSSVPSDVLAWKLRREAILSEINEQSSDVVCLQEVDSQHYHDFWEPQLNALGYVGIFQSKMRPGNSDEDGCATFWRDRRFVLLEERPISLTTAAINCQWLHDANGNVFTRASKDNIAIVAFLQDRLTGVCTIVANTHLVASHSYKDVKIVQAAVLLEELTKITADYATRLPLLYPSLYDIPLVLAGDFNSLPNSAVYQLLSTGHLEPYHEEFGGHSYGGLTTMGFRSPYCLASAYEATGEDSNFTIYTPHLKGTVDYIWYNRAAMQATRVLGPADDAYTKKVPGFPSEHFPSDHVKLVAEFAYWG